MVRLVIEPAMVSRRRFPLSPGIIPRNIVHLAEATLVMELQEELQLKMVIVKSR